MEETTRYDLIVIGSGPAGEKGAAQAALLGKRVALIEKGKHLGGAAANTGTLPSKTLRETALFLSGFQQRELYGIDACLRDRATVQDFLRRERRVAETERQRIAGSMGSHGIELIRGAASFVDAHTIKVSGDSERTLRGDIVLIATGSRPWHPPVFPQGQPDIYDSDTILNLERIPQSLIVTGGGVIGCEYACLFATLGVKVTVIEARDELLAFLDKDLSRALKERMVALGIIFRMPDEIEHVERDDEGDEVGWRCALRYGGSIVADTILIAAGRSGNTESLNLAAAGLEAAKRGLLTVNECFQTAVPSIYAAGDVVGFPSLASASMEQARLAMCYAFENNFTGHLAPILPYGIYTIPEASSAGETEQSAKEKGMDIVCGRASFAANARGQIIGEQFGFIKLVFRREDMRLVGVHIIGESASELVHIGLTAMLAEQGAELFLRTCYNYPTLSESYKYATYDALKRRNIV
ncbi:Si-specific NAD(P)(+) transhydrogenase [Armatimonas sp.]|uniref:Si-specific NAD(P)(+) transhydrogenase n=1 Tax=Armatimonas sp. TaxID=1872638 RepID=UPI00286BF6FB|nr:Si-specific NAD(P)(+) transhydrogenase [Armatimonas sp.]